MKDTRDPVAALQAVRDAARAAAAPPVPAAVRRRAERATRNRRAALATVAVVVAVAFGIAGAAASQQANGPDPRPADTPTPSVVAPSSEPAPQPSASTVEPSTGLGVDIRSVDLQNATLTMPAWPLDMGSNCPAGQRRFRNGVAPTGPRSPEGFPWQYTLEVKGGQVVYGDIDGQPGDELLVLVSCAAVEGTSALLAVRVRPDRTLVGLGYVAPIGKGVEGFDLYRINAGEILVEVSESAYDADVEQLRGYRWRGDRFTQTSGPTRVPTSADLAAEDVRKLDFRNTWLRFHIGTNGQGILHDPCLYWQNVTFVNGRGRSRGVPGQPTGGATNAEVGPVSTGFLADRPRPERAQALITVRCIGDDGKRTEAVVAMVENTHDVVPVVGSGQAGVAGIVRHQITPDGLAKVTVRLAAGGEEVRTYRLVVGPPTRLEPVP